MKFYSTNKVSPEVLLDEALLIGQAPDRGLYMPSIIPSLKHMVLKEACNMQYPQLASTILKEYTKGIFSEAEIEEICYDAYDFEVPIEKVKNDQYILRLDRGPSASFKDFAARFMGRAIGLLVAKQKKELLILTATSGDTGSAVAHAFYDVPGIRALVLFPKDEVSSRQRRQMTTLGKNISTISVNGKFDDCQAMVKKAFSDSQLSLLNLSSANSINIGRLLPQSVYYVYAASKIADIADGEKIIISIPSGNFGNLMGGVLAYKSGLPVEKFVVSTNANDEVPKFLDSGCYEKIEPSKMCISNAMNVGHPSNLARLVDLYGGHLDETGFLRKVPDMKRLRNDFYSVSIDDELTRKTLKSVYSQYQVLLEPHGAVGWAGLENFYSENPQQKATKAISLETAHPAKFPEEIRNILDIDPQLPNALKNLEKSEEKFHTMDVNYDDFKEYLLRTYK